MLHYLVSFLLDIYSRLAHENGKDAYMNLYSDETHILVFISVKVSVMAFVK